MTAVTSYPPGVPDWVDLATPDPAASEASGAQVLLDATTIPQVGTIATLLDPQSAMVSLVAPEAS